MFQKFPFPLSLLEKRQKHLHHTSLQKNLTKHVLKRMLKYYQADQVVFFLKKGGHLFLTSQVNKGLNEATNKESFSIKKSPRVLTLSNIYNDAFPSFDSFSRQEKVNLPLYVQQKLIGVTQIARYRDLSKSSETFPVRTRNSLAYFATMLSKVSTISRGEKLPLLDLLSTFQGLGDKTTLLHSLRVAKYVSLLYDDWLSSLGFSDFSSEDLTVAALLHDLGKWRVNQEILHKKSSLSTYEKRHLATHTLLGLKVLDRGAPTALRKLTETVILRHHQHYAVQPLTAADRLTSLKFRLVQMLDVYDALSSPRSYKEPWGEKKVFEYLEQEVIELTDRMLLQLFLRRLPEMRRINQNYSE